MKDAERLDMMENILREEWDIECGTFGQHHHFVRLTNGVVEYEGVDLRDVLDAAIAESKGVVQ